ncbi:chymotrypsin inhibitor-like [Uranotaenia lowii]|uniref:chymotrypsin inhibitor-like n=1 Tax=Uranotaenia lowii TaxID=190385 RepID=UPI00247AF7A7|nr:chymotrypsin inhibitor-like [Uranotaenia lowii]
MKFFSVFALFLTLCYIGSADSCGPNSHWNDCGSSCEPSCKDPEPTYCNADCVPQCVCESGYVQDDNKNCILLSECQRE